VHILAYISLKLQNVATLSSVALLACNYSIILLILHVHVSIYDIDDTYYAHF